MKKTLILSIFLFSTVIFLTVLTVKVYAAKDILARGFTEQGYVCPAATTEGKVNENGDLIMTGHSGQKNEILQDYGKWCIQKGKVGAIAGTIWGRNAIIGRKEILFCPTGTKVGVMYENSQFAYFTQLWFEITESKNKICCPTGNSYIYYEPFGTDKMYKRCCPLGNLNNGNVTDTSCGAGGVGAAPQQMFTQQPWGVGFQIEPLFDPKDPNQDGNTSDATDRIFECPASSCLIEGVDSDPVDTSKTSMASDTAIEFTDKVITSRNLQCIRAGERLRNWLADADLDNDGEDDVCYQRAGYNEKQFFESGVAAIISCQNLKNENERKACEACIAKNTTSSSNFIYNSLGCVDTSRDGLITRLFQIGVGLIGGFIIFRLISAAIKRQSNDPANIQESNEMVTSSIVALMVLAGAVVILRFLGINVLGILPGTFLGP